MIDWSRARQLYEEVGADDFDEIVDLFMDEVQALIDRLEATSDRSGFAAEMHFLKGSALSLGFSQLAQLCHEGEATANADAADTIDFGQICACFSDSKELFLSDWPTQIAA